MNSKYLVLSTYDSLLTVHQTLAIIAMSQIANFFS